MIDFCWRKMHDETEQVNLQFISLSTELLSALRRHHFPIKITERDRTKRSASFPSWLRYDWIIILVSSRNRDLGLTSIRAFMTNVHQISPVYQSLYNFSSNTTTEESNRCNHQSLLRKCFQWSRCTREPVLCGSDYERWLTISSCPSQHEGKLQDNHLLSRFNGLCT